MLEYFPSDPESPCAASSLRVSTCIRMITSRGLHSCEMHLSPPPSSATKYRPVRNPGGANPSREASVRHAAIFWCGA